MCGQTLTRLSVGPSHLQSRFGSITVQRTRGYCERCRKWRVPADTVIGDGAVWLWHLAADRWPQARLRLDFDHAVQHLAAVGRALFGEDQAQIKSWLKPLVKQLKHGWTTERDSGRASRLAVVRWRRPVGSINAGSSDRASSGVRPAMKP